jgi:hypothetical protein
MNDLIQTPLFALGENPLRRKQSESNMIEDLPACKEGKGGIIAPFSCVSSMSSTTTTATVTTPANNPRKRRRVAFEEDPFTRQVKLHVLEVESSRSMTAEEKAELWFQKESEELSALASMSSTVADSQLEDSKNSFAVYMEVLARTYLACCEDNNGSDVDNSTLLLEPEHMAVLGICHGDTRGLEGCTLPAVAGDRIRRRIETVRSIVLLHQGLKLVGNCEQISEIVKNLSQQLSLPSRRFAEALGFADATSAFLEHTEAADDQGSKTV